MDYDVAIIGGGLIGSAAAYYLSKRGLRAVVIEQGFLNSQASGANAGSLHFQLEHRLLEHGDTLAAQFARVMPLSMLAIDMWRSLQHELGAELEIIMQGGFSLAFSEDDEAMLDNKARLEQQWGLNTQIMTGQQTQSIVPDLSAGVRAAAFSAEEGSANPRLVTLAYARKAREAGAAFLIRHRVVDLYHQRGWFLNLENNGGGKAGRQSIRARAVLNAAGAWMGMVGQMSHVHLPMFPIALQMNVTERAPLRLPYLLQHVSRPLSLKQTRSGNYLIGGGWPARFALSDGRIDLSVKPSLRMAHIAGNLAVAVDVMPPLARLALLRTWSGIVGVTADQLPLLGKLDCLPDYYVAGGGSGFTLGPVYATLIAALIAEGGTDYDIGLYDPNRFGHINAFMKDGGHHG